jgi:predicted amidohydrolase YtcJ
MHICIFFTGAFVNSEYMLTDLFEARSEEECVERVKAFAEAHPDFGTITGMGWLPAFWDNHDAMPHCKSLDAVIADRPVYLLSADCHTFWLNSKALELCRITKETKVSFGSVGKDETGELNGVLFEIKACTPANENAFVLSRDKMKELQKNFYEEIAKNGITSTANMSVNPVLEDSFEEFEVAIELEREGELTVRLHLYPSLGLDNNYEAVKELRRKYASDKLRVSGLKQFVDGVTSTYTAYLLEPYSDRPETAGFSNYPAELYEKCIITANKEGFGVRLHCIGDAAVRLALDALEKSNEQNDNSNLKNTIEHIESIHPDDIPRFAKL